MKKIAIALNKSKKGVFEAASKLAKMLSDLGAESVIYESDDKKLLEGDFDFIVSFGGDGTLLHIASMLLENGCGTAILGINYGHTGYMSEVDFKTCKKSDFEKLFSEKRIIEELMVLRTSIKRNGKTVFGGYALNDLVVLRSSESHVSEFTLSSSGKEITSYVADGIIFATPTGSTAYSLSAGGPIVDPEMKAVVVTPISAHNLAARPIVFSENTELKLDIGERADSVLFAQNDGVTVSKLQDGDEITVKKSKKTIKLLKLEKRSFYGAVNAKLK